jgi:hypothetical protein
MTKVPIMIIFLFAGSGRREEGKESAYSPSDPLMTKTMATAAGLTTQWTGNLISGV